MYQTEVNTATPGGDAIYVCSWHVVEATIGCSNS